MYEKKIRMIFVIAFLGMITLPLLTTNLKPNTISNAENRTLAAFPSLYNDDGMLNSSFTLDFETWINDNIGLRSYMVVQNARMQYYGFNVLANNSDMVLGPNDELNYATEEMLKDYQHLDLKSNEILDIVAEGFQYAKEYLGEKNIQMYYFQCWDKHSIYPEYFPATVIQHGDTSKTDQIVDTLTMRTDIDIVSPKAELIGEKNSYATYSKWGDPTHWTPRGAYIGYKKLMQTINKNNNQKYKVLQERDYNITKKDMGTTLFGGIHKKCLLEDFTLREPKAELTNDKLVLYGEDQRHFFYTNQNVDNKTRVLVLGDSYFNDFILDDLAESFYETFIIWGDYVENFENIINTYNPDLVIVENAERCDRTEWFARTMMAIKDDMQD